MKHTVNIDKGNAVAWVNPEAFVRDNKGSAERCQCEQTCQDKLIGPGGFIDISQSSTSRNISFLSTFTIKGLKVECDDDEGSIRIASESVTRKFVNKVHKK
jgi:acyl CoA:acetate/3-ketoacid CoA transferase